MYTHTDTYTDKDTPPMWPVFALFGIGGGGGVAGGWAGEEPGGHARMGREKGGEGEGRKEGKEGKGGKGDKGEEGKGGRVGYEQELNQPRNGSHSL